MVVKDEALGLEKAILSCKDFVDEIVIAVDNASTDGTLEIAKMYATTLKTFDWKDDFSAARNFAHQGVKTDWILFLDGHEYVAKFSNLEKKLESEADGLLTTIEMESGAIFRNPRIYKNGVQFEGAVHEKQMCKKTELYTEFVVKHDRLGAQSEEAKKEREKQRDDMVPRIMGEMFRKDKRNVRASFHLALHAQSKGKLKKAIAWYAKYLKYSVDTGQRWFAMFNMALCHLGLNNYFRAFWFANVAENECPGRWEISKLIGLIYFQRGEWLKAIENFVNTFHVNTGDESYKPWKHDDADVFNLIGECYYNLGHYDKASMAFGRAGELANQDVQKDILKKREELMVELWRDRHNQQQNIAAT